MKMINPLSGRNNIVLGRVGALSSMKNRTRLKKRGLVVYLVRVSSSKLSGPRATEIDRCYKMEIPSRQSRI